MTMDVIKMEESCEVTAAALQKRYEEDIVQQPDECTNYTKRVLYSEIELLIMRMEDMQQIAGSGSPSNVKDVAKGKKLVESLKVIIECMKLGYTKRPKYGFVVSIIVKIDEIIRLFSVCSFLAVAAVIFSLPCMALRITDYILVKSGIMPMQYQASTLCRWLLNKITLTLSGIHLQLEGNQSECFSSDINLVCFSHASTMDAFIMSGNVATQTTTMVKSSLFLIPFFSWLMFAFGCVPLHREDRQQSIKAIKDAVSNMKVGEALVISPEGSRSKTGLLQPFKKGPFYIWEDLKAPIVPMVITGAFDLYPPGQQMAIPGKVYCHFLAPILPSEAANRHDMSRLLRKRMLECLRDVPADAACELTWNQRLINIMSMLSLFAFYHFIYLMVPSSFLNTYSMMEISLVVVGITLSIYFYVLYMPKIKRAIPFLSKRME